MRYFVAALAIVGVGVTASQPITVVAQGSPVRTVEDGVLDEIELFTAKLPASKIVVIRPFSATDTDLVTGDRKKEETKTMQGAAPAILSKALVRKLKGMGPFTNVSVLAAGATPPAGAILVEGKFTELDPGDRELRYLVGFGAGKSGVTVEGRVKSSDGTLLATFQQRRVGVFGPGGGDSMEKLVDDTKSIGEDIAKFLSAWASGKKLE